MSHASTSCTRLFSVHPLFRGPNIHGCKLTLEWRIFILSVRCVFWENKKVPTREEKGAVSLHFKISGRHHPHCSCWWRPSFIADYLIISGLWKYHCSSCTCRDRGWLCVTVGGHVCLRWVRKKSCDIIIWLYIMSAFCSLDSFLMYSHIY